ncbi:MAG: hypothetical protein SFZ24_00245 [Planctomycetota bacterium]|nr:hypothetical protein [Planctomycetota bacterium]
MPRAMVVLIAVMGALALGLSGPAAAQSSSRVTPEQVVRVAQRSYNGVVETYSRKILRLRANAVRTIERARQTGQPQPRIFRYATIQQQRIDKAFQIGNTTLSVKQRNILEAAARVPVDQATFSQLQAVGSTASNQLSNTWSQSRNAVSVAASPPQ